MVSSVATVFVGVSKLAKLMVWACMCQKVLVFSGPLVCPMDSPLRFLIAVRTVMERATFSSMVAVQHNSVAPDQLSTAHVVPTVILFSMLVRI